MSKFTFKQTCWVFDVHPVELAETQLTIYKDFILSCLYERWRLGQERRTDKEPKFFEITKIISTMFENIYTKALIPVVNHARVL